MQSFDSNSGLSAILLNEMVKDALRSLYADLKGAIHADGVPWFRREQEIVSLFAFGHLVPLFLHHSLDPALLTIEGRVPQVCGKKPAETPKLRGQRDLVVWSRRLDGYWRVPKNPINPFAVMEWKLSIAKTTDNRIRLEHIGDVEWLAKNSGLMQVGYAVFVKWPNRTLTISCVKSEKGKDIDHDFLSLGGTPSI